MSHWILVVLFPLSFLGACGGSSETAAHQPAVVEEVAGTDVSRITLTPEAAKRLAIKTFVTEWHAPTVREAVLRELRRGGQIYFVHNEVRSIEKIAGEVQRDRGGGSKT